jgi:hypothetical protein
VTRYYVVRWDGWRYVHVLVDYTAPHWYRAVMDKERSTFYEERELAESTAHFLGGAERGFTVKAEGG